MRVVSLLVVLFARAEHPLWFDAKYNYEDLQFGALSESRVIELLSQTETTDQKESWRLPRASNGQPLIEPILYDVELFMSGLREEDMEQQGLQKFFTFNTTSKVQVRCNEATKTITMHAGETYDFTVLSVIVDDVECSFEQYGDKEYLFIYLENESKEN